MTMIETTPLPRRTMPPVGSPLPRRVTGFTAILESDLPLERLRDDLVRLAEQSAFTLIGLAEGCRGQAGRRVDARFALAATNGSTGDPQIFALVREIASGHRWIGLEKRTMDG